ncbi:hypothetical protein [Streptomyces sp. NPDC091209]|uniref:hypothetical protein n=1 Tax=Streptomyces sp. NPDC091209 TaxID=3365974 RepID=UPI0037F9B320
MSTGFGDGKTEVLIDRPESGWPALVEADVTGEGNFFPRTVTRTEDLTDTGVSLISVIDEYRGRCYLPADATHLRVTTANSSNDHRWSTRVVPLSAATVLAPEHRGHGDEVLRHNGGPALLTVKGVQHSILAFSNAVRTYPSVDSLAHRRGGLTTVEDGGAARAAGASSQPAWWRAAQEHVRLREGGRGARPGRWVSQRRTPSRNAGATERVADTAAYRCGGEGAAVFPTGERRNQDMHCGPVS